MSLKTTIKIIFKQSNILTLVHVHFCCKFENNFSNFFLISKLFHLYAHVFLWN